LAHLVAPLALCRFVDWGGLRGLEPVDFGVKSSDLFVGFVGHTVPLLFPLMSPSPGSS
jgi:hypothetical protein